MKSKEKIKVFISSKCGGERTNFDKLVKADSSDKKSIADKAIRTNYDLVRRALKIALENTGFIDTYVFEDDPASTSSSSDDFLFELDRSDICLFLIDNFDKEIPEGVLSEIDRAKQTNKKSIYIFLKDSDYDITEIQRSLTGADGRHYYSISDIREFIDVGYETVIADIIKIYQKYCRGNLNENKKETSSVEVTVESFPTDTTDIDKQIFKNLGLTKNKLANLVHPQDEKDIQTSDLDKLSLSVLEFLLGEKKFEDIELESISRTLSTLQPPKLHEIVSRRWDVIASFYNGNLESALSIIEDAYNEFSEDVLTPRWLVNDILIDWRNLKAISDQSQNVYDFSVQNQINQQNSLIFSPLTDRFSANINDDILDRQFKDLTDSPYSTTFYNLDHLFGYISNYLFAAIYYGSYTHIELTLKQIQRVLFDLVQKENNLLHKIRLMRISVSLGEESRFKKIADKYGASLSHSTTSEILGLYEIANTKPLEYERIKWKAILFTEFGYYFSDANYAIISNELFGFLREWIHQDNKNIFLGEKLLKALNSNVRRLSQEAIVALAIEILDKKYYRFFDSIFEILSNLDFSILSKEIFRQLLSQINIVLDSKDKKQDYRHINNLFIRMRKGQDNFNAEIDGIVEKFYPHFYIADYNLEIFPEERDVHIQRYIDIIKTRNETQGKSGRYIGFLDRPYYTVRKIIEIEKPVISEELLSDLLETIFNTLHLETQTHAEKIDAIELLITLKRQKLPHIYNWANYYSKLGQNFSEIKKGHSNAFMRDETLLLQLHLIFIKIVFKLDSLQELLEVLALISSSGEYEIISSLVTLKDFLSLEIHSLVGQSVMPIFVQYISAFCFHDSPDVRYHTVQSLYQLIDSQYADFVVNRLAKMMDDDNYSVKWAILHQVTLVKNINEISYNYIVGKAKIDNNYLVRRAAEKK